MIPLRSVLNGLFLEVEATGNNLLLTNNINPGLIVAIVVALIILIIGSAFFSSSETAYSTSNQIRLKTYVEEKKKGARKALWITENYDRTLTTILVGNNFVNIAATTLAAVLFNIIIPNNETLSGILNTIIMTILVLIFGEILPKCLAKENPEKIALKHAGFLYVLMKILYPVVFLFMKLRNLFSKKSNEDSPKVTEEELETIIDTMVDEGEIDDDDANFMHGMIDSNNRSIYDIMVPRVDIVAIDIEQSIDEIKEIFFKYKFSRIPVYREDKDHIIGILNEKDFFRALIEHRNINVEKMVTTPLYVSKTMKSDDLIRHMQKEKKHFAIVTDEYGGTAGIVTMEDAIEVITGEIYDEHDDIDDMVDFIKKIDENTYLIDPEMPLDDLYDMLDLGKAPESRYSNVGGYLYDQLDAIPEVGNVIECTSKKYTSDEDGMAEEVLINLRFSIVEVVERRIKRVKLVKSEPVINTESKEEDEK